MRSVAAFSALIFALTVPTLAQEACALPPRIDTAFVEPPAIIQNNHLPVDSYVLALSWSPNFCNTGGPKNDSAFQCQNNKFGWVVHGLWPNSTQARSNADQPGYCAAAAPITEATYRKYLCTVPGVKLMSHEWAKHGTCGYTSPENYFSKIAELRSTLKLPDPQALARVSRRLTAGDIRAAFANANPGLPVRAISVQTDRKQRLQEVQVCYDTRYRFAPCTRYGAPDRIVMRVTPIQR